MDDMKKAVANELRRAGFDPQDAEVRYRIEEFCNAKIAEVVNELVCALNIVAVTREKLKPIAKEG